MRVAFLALHFAEYTGRLALAMSRHHEILLVLSSENARDELSNSLRETLEQSMTVTCVELPRLRSARLLRTVVDITRRIRDFDPDVVHVHEVNHAYTMLPVLAMRRKVPVVMTVHDPLPHSGGVDRNGWRYKVAQWARRRNSRLIVHGTRNRTNLVSFNIATEGRVDVVPHGILGRDTIERDVSDCDPHTFLFFGRIEEYKGLKYLLDAGDVLHRRGCEFRILIAGRGSDLARHRPRIAAAPWADLEDRFIPADEIPALFRRALAVVLPYTDATQSGIGALAFAYSRPVIATDVGDVPEVVTDGKSGRIVPPRDARSLADAMDDLLQDRRLRDALAAGAARTAEHDLSWENIAAMTQDVYQRAFRSH